MKRVRETMSDFVSDPSADSPALALGVLDPLIGFRMRRIHSRLSEGFVARLAGHDMRPGGFSAMALIAGNPGLSQRALSQEVGLDQASVVFLLHELETRGWAERRRDPADRRRHRLFLTAQGEAALQRMAAAAVENEKDVRAVLTPAEAAMLWALLDRLYRATTTGGLTQTDRAR